MEKGYHIERGQQSRGRRHLLATALAVCLPLLAALILSGGFKLGTLQPGEILNVNSAHASNYSPTAAVSITDSAFVPSTLTVSAGTQVTWTNDGTRRHRVRDVNHNLFDSDDL